ncbi:glycerophosphodiester phosphodiesterase [bacterium]|nr:glycerophosphodiester phosphodiesterase [bacterium]
MIRIAHRGGAAYAPENTLEACRHGVRLGADYLEVDVRQTLDGKLVLAHDSWWWRRVEGRTYDGRLALFNDYLKLAASSRVGIFPEIKGSTRGLPAAMVEAIRGHGLLQRCVIPSFSTRALREVHWMEPDLPLCQLLYPWQFLSLPRLDPWIRVVAPNAEMLRLNPALVAQAQKRGLQVWPWFAFGERWLSGYVAGLGVDGMILDDPVHI